MILALLCITAGLATGMPSSASAQESTHADLKTRIEQLVKEIDATEDRQNRLMYRNRELADKINSAKQQLEGGANLLVELRLQNSLKASRELADQMEALDQEAYELTEQLVALRQQLVDVLSADIDRLSAKAAAATDTKAKFRRLQLVLQLQEEKEAYQAQITEASNELLLGLEVTIADEDGPDDIRQKAAIIEDQRDVVRNRIQELDRKIQDIQKELSLRQNMLGLLRDIGRGEEDELDLNRDLRIAELQEAVANMDASLDIMYAKKEIWQAREKALARKAERFHQQASQLLRPAPKGDPREPE